MYYRYQSVNYPVLPERIRLPNGDTRTALDELSESELAALGIDIIAGDSPQPVVSSATTVIDFLRRFTQQERIDIVTAAKTDPVIADYQYLLDRTASVHINDPELIAGVEYLESAGEIAEGRAAAILTP